LRKIGSIFGLRVSYDECAMFSQTDPKMEESIVKRLNSKQSKKEGGNTKKALESTKEIIKYIQTRL
jgi:hypothetical protein